MCEKEWMETENMDSKAIGIIMAAGLGSRMRPLTEHTPKPLVPVCGKPMVETILDAMVEAGMEQIYIVTGYLGQQFAPLREKYPQVTLVSNPDYQTVNNISSIYAVRDVLGNSPCYICEGDLVIRDSSLFRVRHSGSVYYGRMQAGWSEDWVFRMEGEKIAWIGKGGADTYNMVGISYFTKEDSALLRDAIVKTVSVPGYEELFWDEVVNDNLDVLSMGIYPVNREQLAELDTVEELEAYERKNILLLKGRGIYDAIGTYIDELAAGFRTLGYNTIILDFEKSNLGERLEWILDTYPLYAVLIVNNAIDQLRKRLELPGTVCVNYYCDHPMYHAGELGRMSREWIVVNLDRKHSAYLKKYFPKFRHTEFIPLSGTPSDRIRPYGERRIDVLFTGSYHVPEHVLNIPKEGNDFARMVYLEAWNLLKEVPHMTLEEVLEQVFNRYEIAVDRDTFHNVVVEMKSVEGGIRWYFRERLICSLLKAGIRVDVFGNGWENLECEGKEHLVIHKGGAQAARRALGDAKIALNIMPWFKAGIQERVVAGMLSGAVALTDTSEYIEEEFTDGEDIVLYHLEHIEEAVRKVQWLLEHGQEAERIAKAGQARAQEKHTWEERAEQIAKLIEGAHGSEPAETGERGKALNARPETESHSYFIKDMEVTFNKKKEILHDLWLNGYLETDDVEALFVQLCDWNEYLEKTWGLEGMDEETVAFFHRSLRSAAEDVIQKKEGMEGLEDLLVQMWESVRNRAEV